MEQLSVIGESPNLRSLQASSFGLISLMRWTLSGAEEAKPTSSSNRTESLAYARDTAGTG